MTDDKQGFVSKVMDGIRQRRRAQKEAERKAMAIKYQGAAAKREHIESAKNRLYKSNSNRRHRRW